MTAATHLESWLPPAAVSTAEYGRELIPVVRDEVTCCDAAASANSVSALFGGAR